MAVAFELPDIERLGQTAPLTSEAIARRTVADMAIEERSALAVSAEKRRAAFSESAQQFRRLAEEAEGRGQGARAQELREQAEQVSDLKQATKGLVELLRGTTDQLPLPDMTLQQIVDMKNPMLPVCNGGVSYRGGVESGYWLPALDQYFSKYRDTLSSVGRVESVAYSHQLVQGEWRNVGKPTRIGTAFYIGNGLAVTAAHVVDGTFDPATLEIKPDTPVRINFGGEFECPATSNAPIVNVRRVRKLPKRDIAVLVIDEPPGIKKLVLAEQSPLPHRDAIVVIGFPGEDRQVAREKLRYVLRTRQDGGYAPDIKRWQPGDVQDSASCMGLEDGQIGHDATTLGNNSGSPVIDMRYGTVVGVQIGGRQGYCNYALPSQLLSTLEAVVADASQPVRTQ